MRDVSSRLDVKRFTLSLYALVGAVALAALVSQILKYEFNHDTLYGLVQLFDVDAEQSLPTYVNVLLLLFASVSALVTFQAERPEGKLASVPWGLLAVGFLYLSLDEQAGIHENLGRPTSKLIGSTHGAFYYAWVVPALVALMALAPFALAFLRRLDHKTRMWLIVAGTIYVSGAVGMELVEGWYGERHGIHSLNYALLTILEETLEMCGIITFIRTLLYRLLAKPVRLTVGFG
jgi:hypothetical protein